MAMMIKDNKVYILVADSDAVKENKISVSTNNKEKVTTNYCPPENVDDKDKFYEILGNLDRPVYSIAEKIKEYYKIMKSRIQAKYSNIFVGNMEDFEENCSLFFESDKLIANKLFLTGDRPYLQFDGNEEWKKFKKIIYGEVSSIVIEPKEDKFLCYPEFHPLFIRKEEYEKYDSIADDEQSSQAYDEKTLKKLFQAWLTSYDNPDYTGTQKYENYANCLARVIKEGKRLDVFSISCLTELNLENYDEILQSYYKSPELINFDDMKCQSKAGIAALKKYKFFLESLNADEYVNFKKLLEFFVNQLRINNDIIDGIKTQGKGSDGDKIQLNYESWRKYENNIFLDCTIQSGFQKNNPTTNYIHYKRYNIRPHFEPTTSDVDYLYLAMYYKDKDIQSEIDKNYEPNIYSIKDLCLFDNKKPNDKIKELFDNYFDMILKNETSNEAIKLKYENRKLHGENIIYYGTPGCGKSYRVKSEYCKKLNDDTNNYIRTIFHPDYTNVDFVGQLLPVKKGDDISYKFEAGPFTKALKLAYTHLDEKVYLIIEELNRGNSAAIFGELFQLLDRDENGDSEYGISNQYIKEELENELKDFIYDFSFNEIKIPSNLSIIATMNTSDQNVYPLDTAFQRRWKMEKIKNNFLKDGVDVTAENLDKEENYVSKRAFQLAKLLIPGTMTTWKDFVETMNERIISDEFSTFGTDDKQIGIYFIGENELQKDDDSKTEIETKKKLFGEKVLKYVWDDLAKIDPDMWFKNAFGSLDKVLVGFGTDGLNIFNDNIAFPIVKKD